jgi:acyl-CoA thioesterase-1
VKNIYLLLLMCALVVGCSREQPKTPNTGEREPAAPAEAPAPPAPAKTTDNRPVIAAFGDSLSAGHGADPGKSYPDFLQTELNQRGYRYRVINAGISGDTTTDGLERVDSVMALKPAIVILEFGGNDGLRGLPVSTTRANLEQIITTLQKAGAKIVLAGMTLPPNYGPEYIRSFSGIYRDLARQYHLPLIPFLLSGVGGNASLMQRDGIHPTAEGNAIVAKTVFEVLQPSLSRE